MEVDYFYENQGETTKGGWSFGKMTCEPVGKTGVSFSFDSTGETIRTQDEHIGPKCWQFSMRLPKAETWLAGGAYQDSMLELNGWTHTYTAETTVTLFSKICGSS
jgi:hypothetical protein